MKTISSRKNKFPSFRWVKGCLLLLLVALCVAPVYGQEKQKMAVYVTGDAEEGIKKVLGSKLVAAITQSGNYMAVERTSDFLAEIQKEQGYARSGNVDDEQISKLGKQFGVQLVCVADISNVLGASYASARLINVETASVIATAEGYSDVEAIKDLVRTSESIAFQLMGIPREEEHETSTPSKENRKIKETKPNTTTSGATASGVTPGEETMADYKKAQTFCAQSTKDGFHDWRIPTLTELFSIYRDKISNDLSPTPAIKWYWTSTCLDKKCKTLQVLNMKSGRAGTAPQRKDVMVMCVR
jgi:hypothetical protein